MYGHNRYKYPRKQHHRNIAAEFTADAVTEEVRRMAFDIVKQIGSEVLPKLGLFSGFDLHFVQAASLGHAASGYLEGTFSRPAIALSLDNIQREAMTHGIPLSQSMEHAVLRGLGAAAQEAQAQVRDPQRIEAFVQQWSARSALERTVERAYGQTLGSHELGLAM